MSQVTPRHQQLMGSYIEYLMRVKKVSIRSLSAHMNVSIKRVREVRALGVRGECRCLDWLEAIDACDINSESRSHGAAKLS